MKPYCMTRPPTVPPKSGARTTGCRSIRLSKARDQARWAAERRVRSGQRGDHHGEQHRRHRPDAQHRAQPAITGGEREVREVHAAPLPAPGRRRVKGDAVEHEEHQRRQQQLRQQRVPHGTVSEAAPSPHGPVLRDRRACRVNVGAAVAAVEVVPDRVVPRVLAPPVPVGREGEQRAEPAHRVVRAPRAEQRAVPAVVLEGEDPHHQARRRQGERQDRPASQGKADMHRREQGQQRREGGGDLQQGGARYRLLKAERDRSQLLRRAR